MRAVGKVIVSICFLSFVLVGDAGAYVRTRSSKAGAAAAWPGGCVFVQPDIAGSPDIAASDLFLTVKKSVDNWATPTAGCSYLQINYDEPAAAEAHYDGKNVIKFRTDKWCHPDDAQSHGVCYAPEAAAITSVYMIDSNDPRDGLILDADVEMNNLNFTFAIVDPTVSILPTPRANTSLADLENTLTHELGHLLGLSHTCLDASSGKFDVDETGAAPPACASLNTLPTDQRTKIAWATMYNFAQPGETRKRSPEADDVAGVCAAYPAPNTTKSCAHTDLSQYNRGCDTAPGARAPSLSLLLILFGLGLCACGIWLRRRLRA